MTKKGDELAKQVELNTLWRISMQEHIKKLKWRMARCVALGLAIGYYVKDLSLWTYNNFPYLRAAVEAFYRARGDI